MIKPTTFNKKDIAFKKIYKALSNIHPSSVTSQPNKIIWNISSEFRHNWPTNIPDNMLKDLLVIKKVKIKQSRYKPGVAQRVPAS
jgi:hypothetical protein